MRALTNVRVIHNPRAGVASERAVRALRGARPDWGEGVLRSTQREGHARELAREAVADGAELVLAVGGDGTVNEVAEGLLDSETTLGVIPVGSGNGLARTLGIPLDPRRALEALEQGVQRRMDVGSLNGRPFLNVAGVGFDAAVGLAFQERGQRGGRRGTAAYVRLALAQLLSYEARKWIIETPGERRQARAFLVAIVNGRQYGAGALIAPEARLNDGKLDVIVVEEAPKVELLLNVPRLFLGSLRRSRRCHWLATSSLVLQGEGPHHRDGEPAAGAGAGAGRLEVSVLPRALRILVPRRTAEDPDGPFLMERAHP
jgi:YegS/Rv2252/BmrU family lipid kinase